MSEFEKWASAKPKDVNTVLTKVAHTLRQQHTRIGELEALVAKYERREQLEKVAHTAIERGTMGDEDVDSFVDRWAEDEVPVDVLEDFVGRAPAGVPLAITGDDDPTKTASRAQDPFTAWLEADPGSPDLG